jgi:ATP-dependent Lon protease
LKEDKPKKKTRPRDDSATDAKGADVNIPVVIPVLPLRNSVFFPRQLMPLTVGRQSTMMLVEETVKTDDPVVIVGQKDASIDNPHPSDIYLVGTAAKILRTLNLADGSKSVFVQGLHRVKVLSYIQEEPYLKAIVQKLDDEIVGGMEAEALAINVKNLFRKAVDLSPDLNSEYLSVILNIEDPGEIADIITSFLSIHVGEKEEILEELNIKKRLEKINLILNKLLQRLELGSKIQSEVQDEINKSQREYYLREQLKAIQKELGESTDNAETRELRERIEKAKMPDEARKVALKEVDRLSKMHSASAEYTVSRTYLDWLLDIPWSVGTEDNLDINAARETLDRDHYGLEKVKRRILEYLAVRKLKNDMKGPILCFIGPPGVGKTSLGRSIANALGRKFVRMSLGGVHDEAEIRGHRRTYIGALPGRIVQGMKKAGSNNPVFMLDEIDKVGADFRGDPSSALLEVLDPEQNFSFSDHYLEVPFDLSKALFIATGNMLETIPPALKDRMEIIEIPSYTENEKLHIAEDFLVPKQLKEHGLASGQVKIQDETLKVVIHSYTRESGVRALERRVADICRGVAREVAEGKAESWVIGKDDLVKYLGQPKFYSEVAERINKPGIVTGLAWTPFGGDILFIEATKMKGKGNLILTGQLGEVMKESAQAAMSYIASRAEGLGIDETFREKFDIHLHVPAGAVPKDGPSAGVALLVALASLLTGKVARKDVAMTGEITLRGAVLPIGGVKEKVLAAHRAGIKTVILPDRNKAELDEVPSHVKDEMQFLFVKEMDELIDLSLN